MSIHQIALSLPEKHPGTQKINRSRNAASGGAHSQFNRCSRYCKDYSELLSTASYSGVTGKECMHRYIHAQRCRDTTSRSNAVCTQACQRRGCCLDCSVTAHELNVLSHADIIWCANKPYNSGCIFPFSGILLNWTCRYNFTVQNTCWTVQFCTVKEQFWTLAGFFLMPNVCWLGYGRSLTCMFVCQGYECAGDVPAPVKTHHFGFHVPIGCLQTRDNRRYHGNKWCHSQSTHKHTDENL